MSKNSKTLKKFVSRAGEKLAFALDYFNIDVTAKIVADFGSSTGGFVDCLLQRGTKKVYSLDTARDMLVPSLKKNKNVEVLVGNAMHLTLKEKVDFITIDVAWTKQCLVLPNALRNLKDSGYIISLVKPQYEAERNWLTKGVVEKMFLDATLAKVKKSLEEIKNLEILELIESPLKGTKGSNIEYLMLCKKVDTSS